MDRDKLIDLIREMQCNTMILKDEIGKQIDELDYIMSACKSLDSQLAMLKNEIEDEDKDETSEKCKLKEGDYLSIPNRDDMGSKLYQIVKLAYEDGEEEFFMLDVATNMLTGKAYSSIGELVEEYDYNYDYGCVFYYINDEFEFYFDERYLIYDPDRGGDYEVKVVQDNTFGEYWLLINDGDDEFYEEGFKDLKDLEHKLFKEYRLVKRLRYSIFE